MKKKLTALLCCALLGVQLAAPRKSTGGQLRVFRGGGRKRTAPV